MAQETTQSGVTVKTSAFGSLNLMDLAKGLIMAVLGAACGTIYAAVKNPDFFSIATLQAAGLAAVGAAGPYLMKNLFTSTKIVSTPEIKADEAQS